MSSSEESDCVLPSGTARFLRIEGVENFEKDYLPGNIQTPTIKQKVDREARMKDRLRQGYLFTKQKRSWKSQQEIEVEKQNQERKKWKPEDEGLPF